MQLPPHVVVCTLMRFLPLTHEFKCMHFEPVLAHHIYSTHTHRHIRITAFAQTESRRLCEYALHVHQCQWWSDEVFCNSVSSCGVYEWCWSDLFRPIQMNANDMQQSVTANNSTNAIPHFGENRSNARVTTCNDANLSVQTTNTDIDTRSYTDKRKNAFVHVTCANCMQCIQKPHTRTNRARKKNTVSKSVTYGQ